MTPLEDLEAEMDDACISILGDSITFRPAGGSARALSAYVEFDEQARSLDGGEAIEQAMKVEVSMADVPIRPKATDRVTLAKIPGRIFQPINVGRNKSGTHWEFELRRVNA